MADLKFFLLSAKDNDVQKIEYENKAYFRRIRDAKSHYNNKKALEEFVERKIFFLQASKYCHEHYVQRPPIQTGTKRSGERKEWLEKIARENKAFRQLIKDVKPCVNNRFW